jgi:hypothetical protein
VNQNNESLGTDTAFSNTPAFHSGFTAALIFVGRESSVTDIYGLKTDKEFVNTFEDNKQEQVAIDNLISDCAKAENSNCINQILCALCIPSWLIVESPRKRSVRMDNTSTSSNWINNSHFKASPFLFLMSPYNTTGILIHFHLNSMNKKAGGLV